MGKIKHIRWIAVIGLLAIIELQYVWLTNTYKLTEEATHCLKMQLCRKCSAAWRNTKR